MERVTVRTRRRIRRTSTSIGKKINNRVAREEEKKEKRARLKRAARTDRLCDREIRRFVYESKKKRSPFCVLTPKKEEPTALLSPLKKRISLIRKEREDDHHARAISRHERCRFFCVNFFFGEEERTARTTTKFEDDDEKDYHQSTYRCIRFSKARRRREGGE